MKIIKWKIGDTPPSVEGQLAVAIGNFDGIHKGHVKLLNECKLQAKESNLSFGVVTFDPHPRDFFNPKNTNNSLKYKRELYSYTNLFRLMFSIELSKRLKMKGFKTKSIACHPGVVKSSLGRYVWISNLIYSLPILPPTIIGIKPIYESITNQDLNGGEFIGFDTKNQWKGNPVIVDPNPICNDGELRNLLWEKTQELTGINL